MTSLGSLTLRDEWDGTSDGPLLATPSDSDQQTQELRDFAAQHLRPATEDLQDELGNLLSMSRLKLEYRQLAEKVVRTSFDSWRLVDFIKSELNPDFDKDPLRHTVQLLYRAIVVGPSYASPPRPPQGTGPAKHDFEGAFYGEGDKHLCHHIATVLRIYNESKHYGRIVPIVQSSGSGKSRTVDQVLRRHHFGMLLCFRERGNRDAFPARDDAAADLLVRDQAESNKPTTRFLNRVSALAWFEAFAHYMAEEIAAFCSNVSPAAADDASNVEDFYDHLNVGPPTSPTGTGGRALSDGAPRRRGLLEAISCRFRDNLDDLVEGGNKRSDTFERSACTQAFRSLQAAVLDAYSIGKPRPDGVFILALDEASSLGPMLGHIRRLWHAMGESTQANANRLVLLLLDTNSSIHYLVGGGAKLQSSRLQRKKYSLLPMLNKLPFDVALGALDPNAHDPQGKTWSALLEQLSLMGRPLLNNQHLRYNSDFDAGERGIGPYVGRVALWKVKGKLLSEGDEVWLPDLNSESATFLPSDIDVDKHMAALCQRLPLTFVGAQGSVDLNKFLQRQISSHLRTIAGLDPDTSFIITGTPSEPILSIAATDLFRQQIPESGDVVKVWRDALWAMRIGRTFYGLTAGADGEEVARTLFVVATDFAAVKKVQGPDCTDPDALEATELWRDGATLDPLPAWDWLVELFGGKLAQLQIDGMQRGAGGPVTRGKQPEPSFKAFAQSARISFTHFVKMPHTFDKVSKKQLAEWFVEHVAICGADNQPSWDLLIPIYVDEDWDGLNTVIDVSKMSYIVVQVKNRRSAVSQGQTSIVPPAVVHRGPSVAADSGANVNAGGHLVDDFEYISLFVQLKAAPRGHGAALSYSANVNVATWAHNLQVIGLDNGFAPILSKLGDQASADLRALLGIFTDEFEDALDWRARCKSLCDAQLSLYARSRQRPTGERFPFL
ncbi:uncharacterized protein PSFLO_02507 [Pseudozyma flocculosa]|uniref:Uncharacterized protein n=1 Tax=Pseudozyma flocculosa TaxID=84751 RepID=A0A5C3EZ26_9BASI|nr:uncharacterized protein PSFLO_02507 [Pseudozyma flocculosa]